MSQAKRLIDRDVYLKALALFTMAQSLQKDVVRFEKEMNATLGLEHQSRMSDSVYNPDETFDETLRLCDIEVAPEQQPEKR